MSKFQLVLRCKSCRHKYKRVIELEADESIHDIPNPPCPKCAKKPHRTDSFETASPPVAHTGMAGIISEQHAPGIVGANVQVRAIDETVNIVMKDYALTDLKDNVRQGDSMAPRLPGRMQIAADHLFDPKHNPLIKARQRERFARLGQTAIKGGFRHNSANVKQLLPDASVALKKVATEQINR